MALRVALVVLSSALFSYLYLVGHQEGLVKEQLSTYVDQRSHQEAEVFRLAQDRHQILKQALLEMLESDASSSPELRLYPWPDGTQRNHPSDRTLDDFDGHVQASIFLGRNEQLTSSLKHRIQVFQQLVLQYGPAWRDRFTNTYLLAPENTAVLYWPEVPGPLMVPGEFDIHEQPFFYLSDRAHNPSRNTAWTEAYHDPASPDWIVSIVTPVDSEQGQHLATIGHDIILTELIEQTNRDRLHGTQNLIFSADGQLIVHPQFGAEIQAQNGELNIQDLANPHLNRIFQQVIAQSPPLSPSARLSLTQVASPRNSKPQLLDNIIDREFLAVAQLDGPGWYFVTVYPKALLAKDATAAAQFVMLSGLIALMLEMTLLYRVLQREVASPLCELVTTTEQLAQGDFDRSTRHPPSILKERIDEIGQLSRAFDSMAQQLQDLFEHQESRIAERTAQLQSVNNELERLSRCDDLTQLANRRCFDETLTQELQRQQRTQQPLSLLLCDIDYFKQYNDNYGHPAGDQCLKIVAQYLQGSTRRATDLAARYGGEEFAMILPATALVDGVALGQQLCDRIHQAQLPHDGSPISPWLSISIGVATSGDPRAPSSQVLSAEAIIAAADQALYEAKQNGRNRVVANPSITLQSITLEHAIEQQIDQRIDVN